MAYETGALTGVNDLLDKLKVFVQANGWTVNSHTTGSILQISKAP